MNGFSSSHNGGKVLQMIIKAFKCVPTSLTTIEEDSEKVNTKAITELPSFARACLKPRVVGDRNA